jgi:antirestriction protein ArdC
MTYKQAQQCGAHVRKSERGALVVYANSITKTGENGEDIEHEIPFMKGYTVFNVEQIDGLPAHFYTVPANPLPLADRIAATDAFMTATGATIGHGGSRAYYSPGPDSIQLPPVEAFKDKESYYATALTAISAPSVSAITATPTRNSWPNSGPLFSVPILASPPSPARITPPISITGSVF